MTWRLALVSPFERMQAAHLADVIPEDRLVLSPSDLPLEPRLRLSVVRDLEPSGTIANLWQIRHGVSDSDGSVDSSVASVEDKQFIKIKIVTIHSRSRGKFPGGSPYRVTLLTCLFSSTTTLREHALGANTCRGSG